MISVEKGAGPLIALLLSVLLVAVYALGSWTRNVELRREAVANGHAEWVVDENGSPVWQWKEAE